MVVHTVDIIVGINEFPIKRKYCGAIMQKTAGISE